MGQYALAQRTIVTAAGAASWEIRSPSSNKPRLLELGISQVTAVAGVYGLGRPQAIGVTPTSPVTVLDESDGNAPVGLTTACVAWGTPPTVPLAFLRRVACPATIGAGVIWTFPRGIALPISFSIVVWVIATAPVCDVWAVIDE
jgi:hypothetical protein